MTVRVVRGGLAWIVLLIAVVAAGCNVEGLLHQSASFGGATAGQRGNSEVVFINNTPYRAIFTFGAYDDWDQNTQPQLLAFGPNDRLLEGGQASDILAVQCARVYSIGGSTMRRAAENNLDDDAVSTEALVPGVFFSSAALGDEEEALPNEGVAAPLDLWIGTEFPCNSLIVYRFEVNDVGEDEFRIDYEVIPNREP
jgi:hypothetical protein